MSKFYEDKELKKIQSMEMGILKDFIKICEDNNLKYFAVAGTGIGAIRHGGFIPWDDDIDVAIPRKDFDRLISIVERDMSDKYFVLNTEHNENFPLMTTRLCIRGTRFVEKSFMNVDCSCGIFLDIYPYDNLADNQFLYNMQVWRAWFYSKLLILRSIGTPYLHQKGFTAKAITLVCKMVNGIMSLFKVDKKKLYNKCKKICTKYNNKETKRFGFPGDTSPNWNTLYKNRTFPCRKWKFEDIELDFPRDIKGMLRNFYGDTFMTMPPVENRKTHYPYILDFGDGERIENPEE